MNLIDPAADLPPELRSRFDDLVLDFDRSWSPTALAELAGQLPTNDASFTRLVLTEMVVIDIERQWSFGNRASVENYLQLFPVLGTVESVPLELVVAECEARQCAGQDVECQVFQRRFPRHADDLLVFFGKLNEPNSQATRSPADVDTSHHGDTLTDLAMASVPLPDTFGRYRIVRELGRGNMGIVYLARDIELDRIVALKIPLVADSPKLDRVFEKRFYAEAQAAAKLAEHPNICSVYDVGKIDDRHYISMAYIEGQTLALLLKTQGTLDQSEAAHIVCQVAEALQFAHDRQVIHRDLKPANIMLDARGTPIVTDFGLARRIDKTIETRLTQPGDFIGTPAYMSPEQVRSSHEDIAAATDIYSLGVTLYELLTARLPFEGSFAEILGAILHAEPTKPSVHRPDLDVALETICLKMLARRPEERYSSMSAVASALGGYQEKRAYSKNLGKKPASKRLNSKWLVASLTLALVCLLSVVLVVTTRNGNVRFEINDENLSVLVDGDQITVEDQQESKHLTPGKHSLSVEIAGEQIPLGRSFQLSTQNHQGEYKLEIQLDGVRITADQFDVSRGRKHVLRAELVKEVPAAVPENSLARNASDSLDEKPKRPTIPLEYLLAAGMADLADAAPTKAAYFEVNTPIPDGKPLWRGNAGGRFFIESRGGYQAWNKVALYEGYVDAVGRIAAGENATWFVNLTHYPAQPPNKNRGLRLVVTKSGRLVLGDSIFPPGHVPFRPDETIAELGPGIAGKFHTLGVIVRRRSIWVFWDGQPVGEKLSFNFDIIPGVVSLGAMGKGRIEFERAAFWKTSVAEQSVKARPVTSARDAESAERAPDRLGP